MITIPTKRLVLRDFAENDANALQKICNQPGVLKWMPDWQLSISETENLIKWYISEYPLANETTARVMLAVTLNEEIIGMVGIGNKEEVDNEIEVAFFLSDDYTGHGYMAEAVNALAEWCFAELKIPYLMAIVETDNYPSQHVVERCGFRKIETRMILNSGEEEEKPFYYYRRYGIIIS